MTERAPINIALVLTFERNLKSYFSINSEANLSSK